jgi:hypothetical protein
LKGSELQKNRGGGLHQLAYRHNDHRLEGFLCQAHIGVKTKSDDYCVNCGLNGGGSSIMDVKIVPLSQVLGCADQPADQAAPQEVPTVSSPLQPR